MSQCKDINLKLKITITNKKSEHNATRVQDSCARRNALKDVKMNP